MLIQMTKPSAILTLIVVSIFAQPNKKFTLEPGYDFHELPPSHDKPLLVEASINFSNILEVLETQQLISIETSLRLYWKDSRVKPVQSFLESNDSSGQYVSLNPEFASLIWMPDIFIDKTRSIRKPAYFTQAAYLRLYNNSLIKYSARFNFDVACSMDFHRYPADEQHCEVKFESFGYSVSQFYLKWKERSESNINMDINLAQFSFSVDLKDEYRTNNFDVDYPGLIMKIHLKRQIGYHLVQTYIPSTLFVFLAWLSLFVQPESIPGRVSMGMTALLTVTAMFSSVRQNVPKVSYVSMLDVWMLACILVVVLCIFEFVCVTSLIRRGRKRSSESLDKASKPAIFVIFVIFNLSYWPFFIFD